MNHTTDNATRIWTATESILRGWNNANLRGTSKRNDKIGAWLSDCAVFVMEELATMGTVQTSQLASELESGEIPPEWRKQFNVLAYRRSVDGWDVGETPEPNKATIAQRYKTPEFWDKIQQNDTPEVDPARYAEAFERFLKNRALVTEKRNKSVGKVIHAFCHYPNLVATEQARQVRIAKTTFYDNWERLKTFLTCAELFELGLDSLLAEATAEAEAEA